MSVSLNSNLHVRPRVAFKGNDDRKGSYVYSALGGAVMGGLTGAGVKYGAQKYVEKKAPEVAHKVIKNLAETSYQKAALIAAAGGSIGAMIIHAFSGKKEKAAAAENLKPIS